MSDRERSQTPLDHKGGMNDRDRSPHGRRDDSPIRNHKIVKSYSRSPSQSRSRKMSYRGGGGDSGGGGGGGGRRDERDRDRDNRGDNSSSSRRYRSRSRSRSEKLYKPRYSHSRSRSHTRGNGYSRRERSFSHSPMSSRRRHVGTRDNPTPSRCLGVFGLSVYTTEEDLYDIFSKYGPVERVQVVIDAKSGRSRGFCFVYFESTEDSKVAKEQCSGMKIGGKSIRVDYSITERAHTPTPGIYMGKPTYTSSDRWNDRRGGGGGGRDRDSDSYYGGYRGSSYRHRRSPSPYYRRRRYDRSRSRSYSPRRY